MTTIAHSQSHVRAGLASRTVSAVRTEVGIARLALGTVALHVADDNFLQPNPGMSAADHSAEYERRVGFFDQALLGAGGGS